MNRWFTVEQIHPNIYALAEFHHWEKVVSYLFVDRTQAVLIDTGMGYQSIRRQVTQMTSLPVTVLLTHAHWDHIGSVFEFPKVGVFDHPFERQLLETGFTSSVIQELADPSNYNAPYLPKLFTVPGRQEYFTFKNGKVFRLDTFSLQVIHTPGHTSGSVCFYSPELEILACGDTVYPGPLYAQLPESNVSAYAYSIQQLKRLPTSTHLLPGHNQVRAEMELVAECADLFDQVASLRKEQWPTQLQRKHVSLLLPVADI